MAVLGLRCCTGFLLIAESGGCSLVVFPRLLIAVAFLVAERGHMGFSSRDMWAQLLWLMGSRPQAQSLWHEGSAAPQHMGSSWIGLEPGTPALAGRFFTTELPSNPWVNFSMWKYHCKQRCQFILNITNSNLKCLSSLLACCLSVRMEIS